MNVLEYIKDNFLIFDGGMGTLLQNEGLAPGELPELWNITHPDVIQNIHSEYFVAGANVATANTFGANILKFTHAELDEIVRTALENAREAARATKTDGVKYVALDIGPLGRMLSPLGDLDFEDAVSAFAETVRLGVKYGADFILVETMNDTYETKAALLAAKENSTLPVFVTNAYSEDGHLMTGADPSAVTALLESMGADVIGVNCSLGPKQLSPIVDEYLTCASVPVMVQPNAGLPHICADCGETVYDVSAEEFADVVFDMAQRGARVIGGCCGTTPEHIRAVCERIRILTPVPIIKKQRTVVSSYTHAVYFGDDPILIGERINPTGKKRFKQALLEHDISYILNEGITQAEKGVHILDVNVGLPDIDEVKMLTEAVTELQTVVDLPLQIDTADPAAMESALRRYNGKALINSVNGKQESMDLIFPLMKKYGGCAVALTLDENGIPDNAEDRVQIAKKILREAEKYGITRSDLIFDPLALTISASPESAKTTLDAIYDIRHKLGCNTSLGVSNISFGLPTRDLINSTFFSMALTRGLSAAIINPNSAEMMKTYHSYRALTALDDNCEKYIEFASSYIPSTTATSTSSSIGIDVSGSELQNAIRKGLGERAASITEGLLLDKDPLSLVQEEIIPALDAVGRGFEAKTVYLPQLLMSAEAAGAAFEKIKEKMPKAASMRSCFVLATVKGDIHDIGKNIVKLILENYGFNVVDLGRDVPPEAVVEEVIRLHAPLCGLSALMTTTVPAMAETVKLLSEKAPWCKTVVGGAVLNEETAMHIGADKYAKDAMETVRWAEEIESSL